MKQLSKRGDRAVFSNVFAYSSKITPSLTLAILPKMWVWRNKGSSNMPSAESEGVGAQMRWVLCAAGAVEQSAAPGSVLHSALDFIQVRCRCIGDLVASKVD